MLGVFGEHRSEHAWDNVANLGIASSSPYYDSDEPTFLLRSPQDATRSRFRRRRMSLDWTQGDLREGLRCFHSGLFFEAHEHWESVWLAAEEPEKTFLQGLIQVAASFHHWRRGNCVGAASLLRSALRRLDLYPEVFSGVMVAPLRRTIRLWLEALEAVPQASLPPVPQLQFTVPGTCS